MSEPKIWYLGPLGDLRPLVCPDKGMTMTEERYGGIHQGISGARTMDVTGHRASYELSLSNLDQSEFAWVEALHTRLVPGPFRLINPLKRNRLTGAASRLVDTGGRAGLWRPTGVPLSYSRDWPAGLSLPGRSAVMTGTAGQDICGFDAGKPATILPNEDLRASIYLKSAAPMNVRLKILEYNADGQALQYWAVTANVTTSWVRHNIALTRAGNYFHADTVSAMFFLDAVTSGQLSVAAPMVEGQLPLSPWELGGASPEVVLDQMPVTSPIYPLRSAKITLLET